MVGSVEQMVGSWLRRDHMHPCGTDGRCTSRVGKCLYNLHVFGYLVFGYLALNYTQIPHQIYTGNLKAIVYRQSNYRLIKMVIFSECCRISLVVLFVYVDA